MTRAEALDAWQKLYAEFNQEVQKNPDAFRYMCALIIRLELRKDLSAEQALYLELAIAHQLKGNRTYGAYIRNEADKAYGERAEATICTSITDFNLAFTKSRTFVDFLRKQFMEFKIKELSGD